MDLESASKQSLSAPMGSTTDLLLAALNLLQKVN